MSSLRSLARREWDVLVIGGGITGAGILREAARVGLRALLVEQNDFASGTSSRSSNLIHGGLRYLAQGQLGLVRESIRERARLLLAGTSLVERMGYLLAVYRKDPASARTFAIGLRLYALLHGRWQMHRTVPESAVGLRAPGLSVEGLAALFEYDESLTDDARLVLRVLREATDLDAVALNYTRAVGLVRGERGEVLGAVVEDWESGQRAELIARAVVNASGAWADDLRSHLNLPAHLRPLRGSHLVLPGWRLRQGQVVSFFHPHTGRPIFCVPWQGVMLVGTTDVEHMGPLEDPLASPQEIEFLLTGLQARFPGLNLTMGDVQAVYAGVRPVTDVSTADPTRASREQAVWFESGLLTVTGGKLTTFHAQAVSALQALRRNRRGFPPVLRNSPALNPLPPLPADLPLDRRLVQRWRARYGLDGLDFALRAPAEELQPMIEGSPITFAELRWIARQESVRHLDDLMLRRVRLGLTVPQGGVGLLKNIAPVVRSELSWNDDHWQDEVARYAALWQRFYGVPASLLSSSA